MIVGSILTRQSFGWALSDLTSCSASFKSRLLAFLRSAPYDVPVLIPIVTASASSSSTPYTDKSTPNHPNSASTPADPETTLSQVSLLSLMPGNIS